MTDVNHVVLIGRLTHDLGSDERNFGYLPNGQARTNVSIAVNRSKKNGDEWVDEVNYFYISTNNGGSYNGGTLSGGFTPKSVPQQVFSNDGGEDFPEDIPF